MSETDDVERRLKELDAERKSVANRHESPRLNSVAALVVSHCISREGYNDRH